MRLSGRAGSSPFVLVCDHAGRLLPRRLGRLGLPEPELDRHIAWDIGAAAVARGVAERLEAVLVEQRYSRLVVDCNRPPTAASSIPVISEATPIPGNRHLSEAERNARLGAIFRPYHDEITALLDNRARAGRQSVLVAIHSFTPVYLGEPRPWHVGTLYGRDGRLAHALHGALSETGAWLVGDNQPYAVSDATDWTIPVHGERRGLLHVGIEIRQDELASEMGQTRWVDVLARALPRGLAGLS